MRLSKSSLNAILCTVAFAGACSAPASSRNALSADATARDFGVASYIVEGGTARLLDRDGIEIGQITVTAPEADRRLIDLALVDGGSDEVEIVRPLNGKFNAPIPVDTLITAVSADAALRPMLAAFDVNLFVRPETRLQPLPANLAIATYASATACTGTCSADRQSGCPWQSDSPAGCARPANADLGCTNPSQMAATVVSNYPAVETVRDYAYFTALQCQRDCQSYGLVTVAYYQGTLEAADGYCGCGYYPSSNSWVASCPGTVANSNGTNDGKPDCTSSYDAVPRLRNCADPGSCTKSTGNRYCTSYH